MNDPSDNTTRGTLSARRRMARATAASLWLVAAFAFVAPAGAQTAPPTRPAVVPGSASAEANGYQFGVGFAGPLGSGGGLALSRGTTDASAGDLSAKSSGYAINVGLISKLDYRPPPTNEAGEPCEPIPPRFAESTLTPAIKAESTNPGHAVSRATEVRWPGQEVMGDVAGVQDAMAGPGTQSSSFTTVAEVTGPFVTAANLRTETSASTEASGRRVARSLVTADSIDLGAALISKPRFLAVSASDGSSDASFSFDWVYFLGQYHTGDAGHRALEQAKALLETLWAPLGLKIDLPVEKVDARQNPSSDTTFQVEVSLSPLQVRLSDIPLARDVLGPLVQLADPLLRELEDGLRADSCLDQSTLAVLGVVRNLLEGKGDIGTTIGGVKATTSDKWTAPRPPRSTTTTTSAPRAAVAAAAAPPPTVLNQQAPARRAVTSATAGSPALSPSAAPTTVAVVETTTTEAPEVEVAAPAPQRRVAVPQGSSGPIGDGKRGGVLTWVALVLLGGVVSAAIADRFVLSRGRTA